MFLRSEQPCMTLFFVRDDLVLLPTNVMADSGAGTSILTPAAVRALKANGVKVEIVVLEQKITFGGVTNGMSYPPIAKVARLYMSHGSIGVQMDFGVMGADTDPARMVVGSQFTDPAGEIIDRGNKWAEWNVGGTRQRYTYELKDPTVLDPGDLSISKAYALRFGAGREAPSLQQIATQRQGKGWWAAT